METEKDYTDQNSDQVMRDFITEIVLKPLENDQNKKFNYIKKKIEKNIESSVSFSIKENKDVLSNKVGKDLEPRFVAQSEKIGVLMEKTNGLEKAILTPLESQLADFKKSTEETLSKNQKFNTSLFIVVFILQIILLLLIIF